MRALAAALFTLGCTVAVPAWGLHQAAHVDVRVAVPHVFRVVVHSQQPTLRVVRRLVVTFQERDVAIADGETVQFPPCNCHDLPVRVGYRFDLAEDARAGLYDWPVELRFDAR